MFEVRTGSAAEASALLATQDAPGRTFVLVTSRGAIAGAAVLDPLPFDTELFRLSMGRVTDVVAETEGALVALHEGVTRVAAGQGMVHLTRRTDPDRRNEIRALEAARYSLADVGVIFDHDLRGVPNALPGEVHVATENDIERVVAECATIFRGSRFYHDPHFSETSADELHRRWIWNCFRGRADAVLVTHDPLAFVTCAVDADGVGDIALFGVAPAAQGRGIGQRLLRGALSFFASRAKTARVKTQSTNYAAARMYERGGFRLYKTELTYGWASAGGQR